MGIIQVKKWQKTSNQMAMAKATIATGGKKGATINWEQKTTISWGQQNYSSKWWEQIQQQSTLYHCSELLACCDYN